MTDGALRVALLGYGLAGRVLHRPLLQHEPGLELTHVVTGDPHRARQAVDDVPGVEVVPTAELLWDRADEFDVVVVASANAAHLGQATAALRRGKPTVVDKPLAADPAAAERTVGLAAELGVPLTVFHNRRWDSDTLTAARLLREGGLGAVHRLESRFTRFRPEVGERWREDPAAGGGQLLDLGSHLVDQATVLLGPVARVWAEVRTVRAGARADDDVFLALTHASGATSHLWASAAAPWPGPRLVLQGSAGGWSKQELDGTEAALREGLGPGEVPPEPDGTRWTVHGAEPEPSEPGDWPRFYALLVAALTAGGPLPVDPVEAVTVLRVLDAARASAGTGVAVAL